VEYSLATCHRSRFEAFGQASAECSECVECSLQALRVRQEVQHISISEGTARGTSLGSKGSWGLGKAATADMRRVGLARCMYDAVLGCPLCIGGICAGLVALW
jgi:hypothetical protein